MKVTIIANSTNGLYLFRKELINALICKGDYVTVLTPFDTDVDKLEKLGIELVETPMERRGTNFLNDIVLLRQYEKELKRLSPDLVITYTIKPNVYGGLVCRKLKIPHAANLTGLGTAFEGTGMLKKVVVVLNKIALKKAKVVFFENRESCELFINEKIVPRNRTYVLNGAGVNLEYFAYRPYPRNKGFKFLFIGRVMKEKGINELLEVMRRLRNDGIECSLDVLGYYEEETCKQKLEAAEVEGWLKYYGNQPDVRPFIEACDCFVLPSYHEGMANVNLESASSGRPVITSDIPGCREAVATGSGFLCRPKDVDSLYEVMKKMVEIDREEREVMGYRGRKHMEEVFDKKNVVKETLTVLGKMF